MRRFIRRTLRRLGFNRSTPTAALDRFESVPKSKFATDQERFDDVDQYMADYRSRNN